MLQMGINIYIFSRAPKLWELWEAIINVKILNLMEVSSFKVLRMEGKKEFLQKIDFWQTYL
jgi:hypothetical protein